MKHKILFRGKSVDTGKWVYGFLSNPDTIIDTTNCYHINPDTVCEFTGLETPVKKLGFNEDGNYKEYQKIFENDILEYHEKETKLYGGYGCMIPTKPGDKFLVKWSKSGYMLIPLTIFKRKKINEINDSGLVPNTGYVIPSYDTWNYSNYFNVVGNEFDNSEYILD